MDRHFCLKIGGKLFILIGFLLIFFGCITKITVPPEVKEEPKEPLLKRTGYTIQVGAFRDPDNASRLTRSLNSYDLKAYYFLDESGFLKVRFGDFSNTRTAQKTAEDLLNSGIITEFFIVGPESHAVEKQKAYGTEYLRDEIVRRARSFIGFPYQWGGSLPEEGFDCSGLAQSVYHLVGLNLPRTSGEQFKAGSAVNKNNMRKGDLLFFRTSSSKKVTHVGIYSGDNLFIHAPGKDKKICVEGLSKPYFQNRYVGARTYLHTKF